MTNMLAFEVYMSYEELEKYKSYSSVLVNKENLAKYCNLSTCMWLVSDLLVK